MQKWLLTGILLVAFALRTVALDRYPTGMNPDEASFGYDAYSLLQTGRDQWGHSIPLSLQSFGDFKLPLYSYLAIPSVALFGLNEFSTRIPSTLFGVLAVFATYLMVLELFKNKKLALFSAFVLSISPWHVMLSRGAFEANLTTFFLPFGVCLFLKGLEKSKYMAWSAIIFGVNLFSYHSARLVTPLIVLTLIFIYRKNLSFKKYSTAFIIFGIFCLVSGWTLLTGGATRGADVAIFNPTDHGQAIFERRFQGTQLGLSDQLSRVFSNKVTFSITEFSKNYLTYFSPQFLFTDGPKEVTYGMVSGVGVFYLVDLIFILTSIFIVIKNKEYKGWLFILIWLLLAPIPASLAKGGGFAANRSAIMMPAFQIISAYGLMYLWAKIRRARLLIVVCLVGSLLFVGENYIFHLPINSEISMMYGRREMVEILKSYETNYEQIIVSRSLSEPHIYFAFYNQWSPNDYQKETADWARYKEEGRSFLDQLGEYHLGKYTFTGINYSQNSKLKNVLLVGFPSEFPKSIQVLKTINYPDGKPAILIVDPSQNL